MYDTTIATKLIDQLKKFLGRISPHFHKPVARFIGDMMYGIMKEKDVKLSSIVRALKEETTPKRSRTGSAGCCPQKSLKPACTASSPQRRDRLDLSSTRVFGLRIGFQMANQWSAATNAWRPHQVPGIAY